MGLGWDGVGWNGREQKVGESYPFLNVRAVLSGLKRKRRGEIRIF